jgi:hypothetical protein
MADDWLTPFDPAQLTALRDRLSRSPDIDGPFGIFSSFNRSRDSGRAVRLFPVATSMIDLAIWSGLSRRLGCVIAAPGSAKENPSTEDKPQTPRENY